ncbi:alpha/beta hydrolase family protein [Robiginitalea sp.]|uniref:alpha/beta hydrolase family protein n=1 Tax=Robiginitalea sp. TaxID=1902411 RepID=UPI003C77F12C
MKKIFLILTAFLTVFVAGGQEISGTWNGVLEVQGMQLPLVIHIAEDDEGYTGTMDSPDQGATGIEITSLSYDNSNLKFEVAPMAIAYTGDLNKDGSIKGTFTQMGQSLPLNFSRNPVVKKALLRPQEPKAPYPYYSEEVAIPNPGDGLTLSGTLTLPSKSGIFPVVVLISGSGAQNRDEEVFGHKPFLVLSDYLTRQGIGVLRYDDRGTGKSTGDHTTATSEDLATDVTSAVAFLKSRADIDTKKIGLIGHSEGGLIAPMVASKSDDIAFIVLLAGPGISGYDILMLQSELIRKASGVSGEALDKEMDLTRGALDLVRTVENQTELKTGLQQYFIQAFEKNPEQVPQGMSVEDIVSTQADALASPWMQYFMRYDPAPALEQVKCPVLALNGEKDLQVPSQINLEAIEKHLKAGGNSDFTVRELSGLNHLFQNSATGSPSEYAALEETFAPGALKEISDWILIRVK